MTTIRIGIAVDAETLIARAAPSVLRGDRSTHALAGAPTGDGEWPALESALLDVRAALPPAARVVADVMVLPPLVQSRRITLPALRVEERRHVLTRDAARYFIGARETQVADALPISSAAGEAIAAALPARYATAIVRAAEGAKIGVRSIQPAWWAWAELVAPSERGATRALVIRDERGVDVVRVDRGEIVGVRRFRVGDDLTARVQGALAELGAERASTAAIGVGAAELSHSSRPLGDGDSPAELAAAMAARARGPELLPDAARRERRATVVRHARRLALGAAGLLLFSAGVELWGLHRQLAAVRRERAKLSAAVARAIVSRDSATALEAQLDALSAETRTAPRWTGVIADLTQQLPDDAHLLSLTAMGDSVAIVGEAAHAADVFEALRRDARVAGVRADAPIRREFTADRTPVERFSVTARLTPAALTTIPAMDER